jgi:4-amino-4-deoxy-L-arabinose transferase-like glycosyltransferase
MVMIASPDTVDDGAQTTGQLPLLAIIVCAAVVLGVYLRVEGLNGKSLWGDEVLAYNDVSVPTIDALFDQLKLQPQAPLYYVTLWAWVRAWGLDDVSIRSLSTFFGLLTLPVTYLTWRHLLGRRAMAWAMALLALNSYHIAYSHDAKMYSMVWLLATASSGCFLNAVSGRTGRAGWLVGYGISSACLPMVSYIGIVPLLIQGIFGAALLLLSPRRRWLVIDAGVVALAAMIPTTMYLQTAVSAASERLGLGWIPALTWDRVPAGLYRFAGVLLLGYRPSDEEPAGAWGLLLAGVFGPCVAAATVMLVIATARSLGRRRAELHRSEPDTVPGGGDATPPAVIAYLALWFIATVAGALAFSLAVYSLWGVPRYLFGAAPALVLWVGAALGGLRRQRLALGLGMTLIAVNLAVVVFGLTHYTRIPWREMARVIEDVAATAVCLELSSGAKPDNGPGASTELSICTIRKHDFDQDCIAYALEHDPTTPARVHPEFVTIETALERRRPFVVLMVVYMGPTQPDGMRQDLEHATPGYACRQLYWQTVYQEPYTAMPTPFMHHSVELWLCVPRSSRERPATDAVQPTATPPASPDLKKPRKRVVSDEPTPFSVK